MNKKDIRAYWNLNPKLRCDVRTTSLPSAGEVCRSINETLNLPLFPEGGSILDEDVKVKMSNVLFEEAIKTAYNFGIDVGRQLERNENEDNN